MIYINGTLVNFSNTKTDYEFHDVVMDYHKTIDELKRHHGESVTFMTRRGIRIDKKTNAIRPPKGYSFPNKIKFVTENGPQEWIYSSSIASIKDGTVDTHDPYFIIKDIEVTYSLVDEPDFVFFLLNHRAMKSGRLKIYDPEADQRERAKRMREESKLKDMIYSDKSPLSKDEGLLKTIARKWGVSGVDTMSRDAICNTLHDVVESAEQEKRIGKSKNGISEFLDDFKMGEGTKVGALVQDALDKEKLFFSKETNEWKVVVSEDQAPFSLIYVRGDELNSKRKLLIDYLLVNQDSVELIEKAIKGGIKIKYGQVYDDDSEEVKRKIDLKDLKTASYQELQHKASELGLGKKMIGKKREKLIEMITDAIKENSNTEEVLEG